MVHCRTSIKEHFYTISSKSQAEWFTKLCIIFIYIFHVKRTATANNTKWPWKDGSDQIW